jgi:addiction module HigA family antidote
VLLEEFLKPMDIIQRKLAEDIRVPYQRVNEIVNGKRGITPISTLGLARFFGKNVGFWMNLQLSWDLYHANKDEVSELEKIE